MSKSKANATTFRKGKPKTGGRAPGTPNKKTRVIKEAMLLAAEAIGDEKGDGGLFGFMKLVGIEYPPHLMAGLVRMIPQQFETKQVSPTKITYRSVAEILRELFKDDVPVDSIYRALADATDNKTDDKNDDKPDDKPDDKTDDKPDGDSGEQQH